MSRGRILLVEDQFVISTNIKLLLNFEGYEVVGVTTTGEEALVLIETLQPDLILMDVYLSGELDGIETTKLIQEKWDIPVMFLSSHSDTPTLMRALESDALSYVIKSTDLKAQLPVQIDFALYKHRIGKEKRLLIEDLKTSEEVFRSIASNTHNAVLFFNDDGSISFWNDSAEKIFGFTSDEAVGRKLFELIAPDMFINLYKNIFTNFQSENSYIGRSFELQAYTKDKHLIPIEATLSSVVIKSKYCACSIINDNTKREQTEMEMTRLLEEVQLSRDTTEQNMSELMELNRKYQESEEKLRILNASKDKFFSIISHDLRSPLQGLLGYTDILDKNYKDLTYEDIGEIAHDLNNLSTHLYKLLEDLLHWSRIQRGKIEVHPDLFQLRMIGDINISLQEQRASLKNIKFINNIPEDLQVWADQNIINTVLRNLLSNAIKFTPEGGTISLGAELADNNEVIAEVKDNGIGIKEEDKDKLFKIDSGFTTLGTNEEKGTGLGLVLCRELIEKNGGRIWVESTVGEGTTFRFTLAKHQEGN